MAAVRESIKINMLKQKDIVEGVIKLNNFGFGYVELKDLDRRIYVHKKRIGKAFHRDTVKIQILRGKKGLEGKVIEIVERFKDEFVGVVQISKKHAFFVPDSSKIFSDFYIPLSKLNGAKEGQKVIGKFIQWADDEKSPRGEIVRVLGMAGDNETEIHSILHEYGLPYKFDEHIEQEAESIPVEITDEEISKRRDMRDVLTFTIDPDTAKDFDDALSFKKLEDGTYEVGVHIADVSHYVEEGSDLDDEAFSRGTSVYLVDRVVPMLPEKLSNGVCSLSPHEDKLSFSVVFKLDSEGNVLDEWFGRTVIHSDHRFTYEEAQNIIETGNIGGIPFLATSTWDPENTNRFIYPIKTLDSIAKKIRARRIEAGSVTFSKKEVKFVLDEKARPIDVKFKELKDSNKLIEEYMLLANQSVARLINITGRPMVQRVHDNPDPDKVNSLKEFVATLGYKFDANSPDVIKESIKELVEQVKDTPEQNMVDSLIIRTMQKAIYTTRNDGHYGLGFDNYTHFTSPIRRYSDLIVHRILNNHLIEKPRENKDTLENKCKHLSQREKIAQKASRDSVKFKQAEFMMDKVGQVFKGVVTSVVDYGLFVELEDSKCDTLCHIEDLNNSGNFVFESDKHRFYDKITGRAIRLGDELSVVIKQVDLEKKNISVSLAPF
jgi:ribonuclease R